MCQAAEKCLHPQTVWSCIGSVELRSSRNGEPENLKMVQFANGDLLAEVERKAVTARALIVKPSRATFYQGVADLQSVESTSSPFLFFNEAIGWGVFLPLQTAYPQGPDSVPEGSNEKAVQIEREQLSIVTTRLGPNRIAFHYRIGNPPNRVEGTWDGQVLSALPDQFSLAEWKHKLSGTIQTLGDARALPLRSK